MGVGLQDFREGQVENRDKTGNMLSFSGLWRGISTICPWMVRTSPHFIILTPNTLLTLKLSQKTQKNYVIEKILKHSLNSEPLLFLYFPAKTQIWLCHPMCCYIEVWWAKLLFWNLISIKSYREKNLWRGGGGLDPITSGRVKVQMKWFFLFPNLKEQQKSGRSPFTVS